MARSRSTVRSTSERVSRRAASSRPAPRLITRNEGRASAHDQEGMDERIPRDTVAARRPTSGQEYLGPQLVRVALTLVLLSSGRVVARSFEWLLRADPGVLAVCVRTSPEFIPQMTDAIAFEDRVQRRSPLYLA
jgi:hypothetical protein